LVPVLASILADINSPAGRLKSVTTLSPDARRLLDDVAASARLEGQELPSEDLELAQAYLAGEIDAATFQERVRQLVNGTRRPAQSA
jgi:antitoxin VbhA-like protein